MNTIKELYSSPTTKILVVRFGGVLCGSFDSVNGTETFTNSGDEDLD